MAFRFRKSIKLAPGIRMNLSGGGLSWTLGPRGASIGIGKRGTFLNSGIPGSGLYSRQRLSGGSTQGQTPRQRSTSTIKVSLTVGVDDDGAITFTDSEGNPASELMIETLKQQKGDLIRGLIKEKCDEINSQVTSLGELHLHAPSPSNVPTYLPRSFDEPRPSQPVLKMPGFFAKFFKHKVAKIEMENTEAQTIFNSTLRVWEVDKGQFERAEKEKQELISKAVAGNPAAMESFFGDILQDIVWPRETLVSFEVRDGGARLAFDVDLPEVEDMPSKIATAPQRGYKLSVKALGPTNIQKLYAQHVHSIGFRLLGEAFGMLPTVQEVCLSGYSQRKSKITGQETDEYLFSLIVPRSGWEKINFDNLQAIDVLEAFTSFNLRRNMSKTGIFKAIEPY